MGKNATRLLSVSAIIMCMHTNLQWSASTWSKLFTFALNFYPITGQKGEYDPAPAVLLFLDGKTPDRHASED